MKENLNLEQSQQMTQRLSPRQVQFVRLLEMNAAEIEDEVQRQLDDNPALEVQELPSTTDSETAADEVIQTDERDPDDDPADYAPMRRGESSIDSAPLLAADAPDLNSYLIDQLGVLDLPDLKKGIAAYVIGNLDENGYMTRSYGQIADDLAIKTGIDITRDDVIDAAEVVRGLDPAGVGAVDLRDCLLLQLYRLSPNDHTVLVARNIIENYFDLFSKKHFDRLRSALGVSTDEMSRAMALIRTLNPKPGSSIAPATSDIRMVQISPDVLVESVDDRFSVSMAGSLPALQIESSFAMPDDGDADDAPSVSSKLNDRRRNARAFIKLKRDDAEAFISALRQRASTLLAVTEAIVRLQPDFFRTGDQSTLRPMILKDLASVTGLDISVISRATAGKYVATDSGTYPLKMFFSEAPNEDSDVSVHKILHELREVIDHEDKKHPYSDEAIRAEMLRKGYKLARRTVTKYRERLGIPVGRLRKTL